MGHLEPWHLMPTPEDTCPECAVDHPAEQPHNQQSLAYQYNFYNKHGRWPTWADALAHCPPDVRAAWVQGLGDHGVEVDTP